MSEHISIDDFHKVEITVGEIVSAEPIEGSDKLLKLKVNFGTATGGASPDNIDCRQVLSGIAKFFPDPGTLVGKRVAFVTNLAPRSMMELESQAMLLAAGGEVNEAGERAPFSLFETTAAPGSRVH